MDHITIEGVRAFGHHGVLAHERECGQEFIVDVRIGTDFSAAVAGDDLTLTIDYGSVATMVTEAVTGTPVNLIETLADRIAADIVALPAVIDVTVVVHKPHAPMPVGVADVKVSRFRRAPQTAYLGLGANLGETVDTLRNAIATLESTPGLEVSAVSSLYRTDPVGGPQQPDFVNAVVAVRTSMSPHELLALCHAVEEQAGRVRTQRWGPRSLDVDIIDYPGHSLVEPDLQIPHPRAALRGFVVVPMAEVAPDHRLGGRGPTVLELSESLSDGVYRESQPVGGWPS